jgi:hypothetical protein
MALPRLRGAGIVAGLAQVQTRAARLFPDRDGGGVARIMGRRTFQIY